MTSRRTVSILDILRPPSDSQYPIVSPDIVCIEPTSADFRIDLLRSMVAGIPVGEMTTWITADKLSGARQSIYYTYVIDGHRRIEAMRAELLPVCRRSDSGLLVFDPEVNDFATSKNGGVFAVPVSALQDTISLVLCMRRMNEQNRSRVELAAKNLFDFAVNLNELRCDRAFALRARRDINQVRT